MQIVKHWNGTFSKTTIAPIKYCITIVAETTEGEGLKIGKNGFREMDKHKI